MSSVGSSRVGSSEIVDFVFISMLSILFNRRRAKFVFGRVGLSLWALNGNVCNGDVCNGQGQHLKKLKLSGAAAEG